MSNQFCEVCLNDKHFKRIEIEEEISMKGMTFNVVHEYDQCDNCKELFEPIEDIDKNIKQDFIEYRKQVGFLQPEEIRKIREKYGMNLRQFAELLGIGYSTLSHIENGSLQSWYQNSLFVLVASPQAMYSLLDNRLDYTKEDYSNVIERVKELVLEETNEEYSRIVKDLEERIDRITENTLHITRSINNIEFDSKKYSSYEDKDTKRKERNFSWIEKTSSLFQLNF